MACRFSTAANSVGTVGGLKGFCDYRGSTSLQFKFY